MPREPRGIGVLAPFLAERMKAISCQNKKRVVYITTLSITFHGMNRVRM